MKNTVSSFEDDDASTSASFRYTITARQSLIGHEEDGFQFKTFDLEPYGTDSPAIEGLFSRDTVYHPVMNVNVFTVNRDGRSNNVVEFAENPEGRVCLCDFDSLKDINAVLQLATTKGAIALLIVKKPMMLSLTELPVFVLANEAMHKFSDRERTTVTFQKLRDDSSETSSAPSDEGNQDLEDASSFSQFEDANMDGPGVVSAHDDPSRESMVYSTGDASHPIDLSAAGTTNASEMVDEPDTAVEQADMSAKAPTQLSSPQYTVTLNEHSSDVRPWTLVVDSVDSRRHVVPGVSHSIMVAEVTRNTKTNKVLKLNQNPKKSVLVYASDHIEDIHRVQKLAAEKGAAALFVACMPKLRYDIPLFVVESSSIQKMSGMQLGTAKFEECDTNTSAADIDHPLATPRPSYAAAVSGDLGRQGTVAASHTRQPIGREVTPFNYSSTDALPSEGDLDEDADALPLKRHAAFGSEADGKKSKKSIPGQIVSWIKETVIGKEDIFNVLKDRSAKSILSSYRKMENQVDAILREEDVNDINKMVSEAESFLKRKECALCHIAASAYICEMAPDAVDCRGLELSVFAAISDFDVSGTEFRILEPLVRYQRKQSDDRKALRNLFYWFLTKRASAFPIAISPGGSADGTLIKVLLFLSACGLLRRKFQQETWRSLRTYVDPNVFDHEEGSLLASVTDEHYARTFGLCFRRDLNDFVDTALAYVDLKGYSLQEYLGLIGNILLLLIDDQLGDEPCESDLLSSWNACLVLLEREPFAQATRKKIISAFLMRAGLKCSRESYSGLSKLLGSVGLQHPYHQTMQACVKNRLSDDLKYGNLDWTAMDSLLRATPLANLLLSLSLETDTLAFVDRAIVSWSLLENKLLLIDGLLKLFVRQEGGRRFVRYERHLRSQLKLAVKTEDRTSGTAVLTEFLRLVATEKGMFVIANSSAAFKVVAESIVTVNSAVAIVFDPISFRDAAYTADPDADLYHLALRLLRDKVLGQCNTIDKAARFYGMVIGEPLTVMRYIAKEVFVSMFKKWNPTQITHIQPEHKKVMDVLFSVGSSDSIITDCQELVRRLVNGSLVKFSDDEVSRDRLEYMLGAAMSKLWCSYEEHYLVELPCASTIEGKLVEVGALEDSIRQSLSVSIDDGETFSLARVLCEYNCDDDGIRDLLRDYEYLFLDPSVVRSATKTLRQMTNDDRLASELATRGQREFCLCAYFIAHQSLLFRDGVLRKDGQAHSLSTLWDSVGKALSWFETVFGPNSHYAGVCSANTAISTLKSNSDSELDTLVRCSELKISSTDIEKFRLVRGLLDMSQPIQRFVACCEQFDFAIVHSDTSFAELQQEVEAFYESEPESRGVDNCTAFSRTLCRILFPHIGSEQANVCEGLLAITPILRLFSTLSVYPELWNYASEMEWFGEEGLKRFYEEYGNVTNVLLGDSESYEMSLLDAMEPAMRVVSAIGSVRESSTSILELFESCKNHEDVEMGLKGGIEHHIRQVHSKLSEIKDWFSNGIDEIASAHTQFSAANLTGSYSIAKQGAVLSNAVLDPFGTYLLTLSFVVDTGESKVVRMLQGDALDHFIQQLSLIQSENSTTSVEMQGFVDQYQVLVRASRNVLTMFSVGYENAKISDFGCQAGITFDDDANLILKTSEMHLQNFTSWLRSTRENVKESLLFWTEELRDLYTLIQDVGQNAVAPAVLSESVARLEPLWNGGRARLHTLLAAVERCATTSTRRVASTSSSWLVEVSRFLGELHLELGGIQESVESSKRSDVVLHSYCCGDDDEAQVILKILHHIYKDRSPWSFEVLDGAVPCSCDRMALFLERVKAFPAFRFVVMNVNLFESKVLEKLLSFLSDREIASLGISFHCIQQGETLHTAPWISERSWDCDALATLQSSPPNSSWQSRVFSELAVVSSASCGTGKTRYIRDEFKSINKSTTQVASVIVHERTSVASLIRSLKEKFPGTCQNRVLHVSFAFLPSRERRRDEWVREINYFFFSLVALRSVYDPISMTSFSVAGTWKILFEMPVGPSGETAQEWLLTNFPVLAFYSRFREPRCQYIIDDQARRVCTYLRALSTGTINRKFEGAIKRIVLVLDCSGSMEGVPFRDAVRNAVSIFDSHIVEGDEFGVILFDGRVYTPIPVQTVGTDRRHLRQLVQSLPYSGGGTSMYRALSSVLQTLLARDTRIESWIVCLTDGVSDESCYAPFRQTLMGSPANLHVISVGINLHTGYEQRLRDLCQKYGVTDPKGFFVRADGTTTGMDNAFDVVKSRIPVSQTFDKDGAMSDDDCRQYMAQYLPSFVDRSDMISQSFWIRFLYRRVKVFDNNDSFNYNEKHDALGSSLMEVMLSEVERLLGENLRRDWLDTNHAQLIYDFTNPEAPEFRLVCTAPDKLNPQLRQQLSQLDLPGFEIPTKSDLDQRGTLDRFLSQALDISLQTRSDGSKVLLCIDDNGFILTLDFTMKLLSIHERVACRIPCLIEGETGVSKSALTKMYSILRNSSLASKLRAHTITDLEAIEGQLADEGYHVVPAVSAAERLRRTISDNAFSAAVATRTLELLRQKMKSRPAIFAEYTGTQNAQTESSVESALHELDFFSQSVLEKTFFDINVDSSLGEKDFVGMFQEIRAAARKLSQCDATIVVFLDEINTSSVLGLLKEVVIDRSIAGDQLEENIVVVAALNPPRAEIQSHGRERDLGKAFASGHYQVARLPSTMNKLKWSYGSLTHGQEKDFIYRRIEALHSNVMPAFLRASLTEVVSESHEIMRRFALRNIMESMRRARVAGDGEDMNSVEEEARARARSVVSLRDIQRVFALFEFFFEDFLKEDSQASNWLESETQRRAMLLAVATVYYLRLDGQSRDEFISMLQSLPTETGQTPGFLEILDAAMASVIAGSEIPLGIAITRGLKENIFVTLVCSLSQTPLLIVGPPGTSKTLSVNVVDQNANGTDSLSKFYGKRPRLSLFHYQCSKQSTSREISAVFSQAIQRQERIDARKHRCVVFMDEAGLPESERESLKVLHYLLEGHMSAKAKVGYVAISNHVLDAAKSNRCVMLLRQEPDEEEMQSITTGVLFDVRGDGRSSVHDVDIDAVLVSSQDFATKLCTSYASLFRENSGLSHLVTFFGLRDYIYFLKAVRTASRTESTRLHTSVKTLVAALERNFNGITAEELRQVSACFLKPFATLPLVLSSESLEKIFRHPMVVLKDALTASSPSSTVGGELVRPRFKLVIDCTEDDSILRLLSKGGVAEVTKRSLYKLSNLPDNVDLERLRVISGVKFAALQGNFAVLSQTETINESFYDLFNQRFREVTGRDGKVSLYANIAVGGISRRSLVRPHFECVVHVRESNMVEIPAPFLNRFEKYRLTLEDVLAAGWSRLGSMAKVVGKAQIRTAELAAVLQGRSDTFGWMESRETLDSLFVDMLPQLDERIWDERGEKVETFSSSSNTFCGMLCDFLEQFTSLRNVSGHTRHAIRMAQDALPVDLADALEPLISEETSGRSLQDSLESIVLGTSDDRSITSIFSTLIQMVITRAATFRLIRLATPESIFSNRRTLPSEIVHEYFQQEHFSLKRLLMGLSSKRSQSTSLHVIHTRSDQFIHAIPSLPADRGLSSEDSETVESVQKLVHEQIHCCVIEHLSRLRSEALVRGAIQTWAQDDARNLFLLLVDMSHQHALDRTNFVRMVVEQHLSETADKTFALLLHYSPSSYRQSQCYPALFLGGWSHVFLDSVGNDSSAFDVDGFVALACQDTAETSDILESGKDCVRQSIKALFPRILPYLASQKLFYRDQDMNQNDSFYRRKNVLGRLMNTTVGDCTIGDILCEKFSAMWLDHALFSTTRSASEALLRGTTQLSLSMSIHSVLIQSFQVFLGATLAEANQWMNLDLANHSSSNTNVLKLFGLSLRGLPVLPFEELVLQRKQSSFTRLRPVPTLRHGTAKPLFPFFFFMSGYVDELVETILERHMRTKTMDSLVDKLSVEECLRLAMDAIEERQEDEDPTTVDQERRSLVKTVVQFVARTSSEEIGDVSLFERYLRQFLEWKVGCRAGPFISNWLRSRLDDIDATVNIVAIHVVARLEQMDVMKVASIVTLADSLQEGAEASVPESDPESSDLFAIIFDTLERAVVEREPLSASQWSLLVSSVLCRTDAALSASCFDDEKPACRLRRLSLLLLSDKLGFLPSIEDSHWLYSQDDASVSRKDYSLSRFLESIDLDCSAESRATELLLFFFLSPTWTTAVFKEDDLSYLLQRIKEGKLSGPSHQTAVSLLRSVGSGGEGQAFGFSVDVLLMINAALTCRNLAIFSSDSKRACVPHFVPEWLRKQSAAVQEDGPANSTFFAQYEHCFDSELSTVTFDLLVSAFACEADNSNSEQLFLVLQREMESELSLNRQSHTQLSRLRAIGKEPSLRGTPLAAIALSARLICFISKVAFEVATGMDSCVFSGTYTREALAFINELMSLKQASWQHFFMNTILKLRGEGTLFAALGPGGPLGSLGWCREWAAGIPTSQDAAVESMRLAEAALAEAVAEEERKTRELRLCPHCGQLFIVAQANCGQFTCGRDAHRINGQPALNNIVVNDTHGCGQQFDLATAPHYRPDETILAPLRARIADERSKLERCQQAATLWEVARSIVVPPLVHLVKTENPHGSFLPSSQLLSATATHEETSPEQLVQVLWESTNLVSRLQLLPDLVELYMWLHDTFRFLVTREDAFKLVMGELMTKEQLRQRFDSQHVQHLMGLWERCRVGLNEVLARTNRRVHWQCETVSIPFEKLAKAKLVSLLSEGQHPTDGNDFLFLIINETVDTYNVFAEKLAAFSASAADTGDQPVIAPKYIVRGLAGALKIGAVLPLTKQELNWMAESCWNSEMHTYDSDRLRFVLQNAINLQDRPSLIANPFDHLRARFCFRDDGAPDFGDSRASVAITIHNGLHFANRQDAQLVDEVHQLLISRDVAIGDQDIRRTLVDNFHGLDYDSIRAILEGIRSLFDLLLSHEMNEFQTIGSALDELVPAKDTTEHTDPLRALGFPTMSEKQSRLVRSLDVFQTVDCVKYASHQLASEAYLFVNLPLYMTDPLNVDSENGIKEGLDSLCNDGNVEAVVERIDEFVRDVLSFYETQIVDGAAKTNSSLRAFLSENNFCDAADPVFTALPPTVSLRHYVSLRQLLHQTKLSFMFRLSSTELDAERNDSLTTTTRGRCWLWEDEDSTFMDVDKKKSDTTGQRKLRCKLWFEQALSGTQATGARDTEEAVEIVMEEADDFEIVPATEPPTAHDAAYQEKVEEEQDSPEDADHGAVVLLQRWWRREMEFLANMDFSDDEESSFESTDMRMEQEAEEPSSSSFDMLGNESSDDRASASEDDAAHSRSSNSNMEIETSYGRPEDELEMRTWLDAHHLPQTTADALLTLGARCIEDVCMLIQECPDLLEDIPPLDRVKLKKTVMAAAASDEN